MLKTAAETLITIAADPKHLGARIGLTAVLHTWGSTLTHHPHAHIIVPGGGFSLKPAPAQAGGQHWIPCRPGFFLSVRVLSRLFRRLFLERLATAYHTGRLEFFADQAALAEPARFKAWLAALRKREWVVYSKRPFGGPDAVLAYLSRYTHRIAIANSRLVAFDGERVTFKWKDYRAKADTRYRLMTLAADEFIRRFLIHVLPDGSTASVITASSPMPTGPATSHWPASSSACPTQPHRAGRATAPKVVRKTKSGTPVRAAAGA